MGYLESLKNEGDNQAWTETIEEENPSSDAEELKGSIDCPGWSSAEHWRR